MNHKQINGSMFSIARLCGSRNQRGKRTEVFSLLNLLVCPQILPSDPPNPFDVELCQFGALIPKKQCYSFTLIETTIALISKTRLPPGRFGLPMPQNQGKPESLSWLGQLMLIAKGNLKGGREGLRPEPSLLSRVAFSIFMSIVKTNSRWQFSHPLAKGIISDDLDISGNMEYTTITKKRKKKLRYWMKAKEIGNE